MSLKSHSYLTTTDYHSTFFEIDLLNDLSAQAVITKMKKNFARLRIPEEVVTDSGQQYASELFKDFATTWDFVHTTFSPGNHRANGAAEAAVKTAKRLFKKCKAVNDSPYLGLLNSRNTPTEGSDTSPSQKLFGRKTRTALPVSNQTLMISLALKSK